MIDSKLSIPLMIIYPEFSQFDLVASSFEEHKVKDHLKQMIDPGLPWDAKHEYTMDTIEVYCEVSEAVLMKIPKQAKIGDILDRVYFREALELQVVRKGNTFYETYIPQHKIIWFLTIVIYLLFILNAQWYIERELQNKNDTYWN